MEIARGNASSIQFFIQVAPSDIKSRRLSNLPNDSIKSSIVLVKSLLLLNWATYCELLIQPCFESACMQSLLLKKRPTFTSFQPSSRVRTIDLPGYKAFPLALRGLRYALHPHYPQRPFRTNPSAGKFG